jgi:hypothetical protein
MRTYLVEILGQGSTQLFPIRIVETEIRIRQFIVAYFKKVFGRPPSKHWACAGFMGEAWDKKGNRIIGSQINYDDLWKM